MGFPSIGIISFPLNSVYGIMDSRVEPRTNMGFDRSDIMVMDLCLLGSPPESLIVAHMGYQQSCE